MNFKKLFLNIIFVITIFSSSIMIQSSGLIPLQERLLMENNGLSRVQAKNYLDFQRATHEGWSTKSLQNILNRQEDISPFLDIIKDENGNTILHTTILANPDNLIPTLQVLLQAGADINTQNNDGDTILHLAMRNYNQNPTEDIFNLIRFILDPEKTDADIDLFNKNHESPRTLNSGLIKTIVAEQHEIKHNQALKAYENYKKSQIKK
jgi:ankyrin repeat protein